MNTLEKLRKLIRESPEVFLSEEELIKDLPEIELFPLLPEEFDI